MDLHLQDKAALVTGSTQGIGKAIAAGLLREGARVVLNGRSEERLRAAVQELGAESDTSEKVHGIAADLSTPEGAERLAREASALAPVDLLVNNLGYFELKPFFEIGEEEWLHLFNLNVMSGVRITRALMPGMLERGHGRILFIASEAGVKPTPGMIHYSVMKTAQIGLARGLAEMTRGTGVTVNSILSGPTNTEGIERLMGGIAEREGTDIATLQRGFFQGEGATSLLQRFGEPEDVAAVAVFLCSEVSSAINGAAVRAEGGIIRSIL
ncbi:MAG: SDR family NAD(P)-dependent oxidoreductase [Armatimonadetes bacterium]|nr:SDR family NAD(P)-dependent oxidoreductase [Armatimonadota bacterium]